MSLHLKPNAREKKNFGGRDTIGQSVGAECGTRATSLLHNLAGAEDFARCEQAAQFDVTEVEQQWWATAAERKEEAVQPSMQVLTTAPRSSPHRWVTAAESKEEAVQPSMQVLTTALPDPLPTGG